MIVVFLLLGESPASEFYGLTFRNTLSAPTSLCRLWRWNWQGVPKRRHIKFRCWRFTQTKEHDIQNAARVWNQVIGYRVSASEKHWSVTTKWMSINCHDCVTVCRTVKSCIFFFFWPRCPESSCVADYIRTRTFNGLPLDTCNWFPSPQLSP